MLVACQLSFGVCVCVCAHGRGLYIFDFEHLRVFVLTSGAEAWGVGGRVYIVAKSFSMFGVIKAVSVVLRCGWWVCGQVTLLVSAEPGAAPLDHLRVLRLFAASCGSVCAQ